MNQRIHRQIETDNSYHGDMSIKIMLKLSNHHLFLPLV